MSRPGSSTSTTRSTRHLALSLWEQIDGRIKAYVAKLLKVSEEEAFRVQKDYYKRYGTSLRGLMIEHGMSPDDFLSYVHDIDHSPLQANPELGAAIAALPGRKFVFTSGTHAHVAAVTRRLGIDNHFDGVFDIVDAGLLPKPHRVTYEKFLADHGVDPTAPPCSRISPAISRRPMRWGGMRTVLVVPEKTREVFREAWEFEGRTDDHIDHVTDDLTAFLVKGSGRQAAAEAGELQAEHLRPAPGEVEAAAEFQQSEMAHGAASRSSRRPWRRSTARRSGRARRPSRRRWRAAAARPPSCSSCSA